MRYFYFLSFVVIAAGGCYVAGREIGRARCATDAVTNVARSQFYIIKQQEKIKKYLIPEEKLKNLFRLFIDIEITC